MPRATIGEPTLLPATSGALASSICSAFHCVVADPPWVLEIGKTRTQDGESACGWNATDGRQKQLAEGYQEIKALPYPQMTVAEICALKIPAAADAHLYLWTINRYIEESYTVARAWGFSPSTMLFWLKQPMGLGLGGAFVNCVEPILFSRRGNLPCKRRCDRNWWGWPRGKHSEKPEEFQTIVESVSPGPYLELFARRKRPGWASWGNQIASDLEMSNDAR